MQAGRKVGLLAVAVAAAASAVVFAVPPAAGVTYAPLYRPGPPLDVPSAALAASLDCHLVPSAREPVLLVPGTTVTPAVEFSWSYERAFTKLGLPWCAVTLPDNGMADIQTAGEYVVYAVRTLHARTGRKVQIVGHSQGGMVPRWALRFWPDTRPMVDDVIAMAPSNHGTVDAELICAPVVGCAPSIWQQELHSPFIQALNSGAETFAGISYTDIYTQLDEVVVPNLTDRDSSSLHTGAGRIANIAVQSVCPLHLTDHLLVGTADPVAYALVMDALTHDGPAVPSRIARTVCGQLVQPGVDLLAFPVNFARMNAYLATVLALTPHTPAPPPLAAYTRG